MVSLLHLLKASLANSISRAYFLHLKVPFLFSDKIFLQPDKQIFFFDLFVSWNSYWLLSALVLVDLQNHSVFVNEKYEKNHLFEKKLESDYLSEDHHDVLEYDFLAIKADMMIDYLVGANIQVCLVAEGRLNVQFEDKLAFPFLDKQAEINHV